MKFTLFSLRNDLDICAGESVDCRYFSFPFKIQYNNEVADIHLHKYATMLITSKANNKFPKIHFSTKNCSCLACWSTTAMWGSNKTPKSTPYFVAQFNLDWSTKIVMFHIYTSFFYSLSLCLSLSIQSNDVKQLQID